MSVVKLLLIALVPVAASIAGGSAAAGVVTFEEKGPEFSCVTGDQASGGLNFSTNSFVCYYTVAEPADFPTAITSTVAAFGFSDVVIAPTAGGVFNLYSVDLAFGPFGHNGATNETTLVTGYVFGGGTLTTTLSVGYGFETHTLNWANLTSVTFAQFASAEYLGFDNVVSNVDYSVGGVPEPATWALMIGGFGFVGAAMRRRAKVVTA